MDNRSTILVVALTLVIGITTGLAAGYSWGYSNGKKINTIHFGPDCNLQWKEKKQ